MGQAVDDDRSGEPLTQQAHGGCLALGAVQAFAADAQAFALKAAQQVDKTGCNVRAHGVSLR